MQPNPRYDTFVLELKKLKHPWIKWKGLLFRTSPLKYARAAKLLDGKGSLQHGGRWSSAGSFPANNLSLSPETALAESSSSFTYYNFAPSDVRPRLIVAIDARFSRVVNLVKPDGIRRQGWLGLNMLLAEDWRKVNHAGQESLSQAFGRAAHDLGAEALLVPSARVPGGLNLVYFPESLAAHSKVEILDEGELNRWLRTR